MPLRPDILEYSPKILHFSYFAFPISVILNGAQRIEESPLRRPDSSLKLRMTKPYPVFRSLDASRDIEQTHYQTGPCRSSPKIVDGQGHLCYFSRSLRRIAK